MEDDAIQNTIWKATQSHHNAIIPRHEWQPKNSKFTNNEQEPEENTTSTKNLKQKQKKKKEKKRKRKDCYIFSNANSKMPMCGNM